ncbi:MAG: hypothetical protein AAF456_20830 [Planctomycetota bacterium]
MSEVVIDSLVADGQNPVTSSLEYESLELEAESNPDEVKRASSRTHTTGREALDHDAADQKSGPQSTDGTNRVDGTVTSREAFLEQSRQLVRHLQAKEIALNDQDSAHHVRVWNWERQVMQQQQEIEARWHAADEREASLLSMQFELLELQNELIDSQLSTRAIVSELSIPVDAGEKLEALESLKDELTARYDSIYQQWQRLYKLMQGPSARDENSQKRCA